MLKEVKSGSVAWYLAARFVIKANILGITSTGIAFIHVYFPDTGSTDYVAPDSLFASLPEANLALKESLEIRLKCCLEHFAIEKEEIDDLKKKLEKLNMVITVNKL